MNTRVTRTQIPKAVRQACMGPVKQGCHAVVPPAIVNAPVTGTRRWGYQRCRVCWGCAQVGACSGAVSVAGSGLLGDVHRVHPGAGALAPHDRGAPSNPHISLHGSSSNMAFYQINV